MMIAMMIRGLILFCAFFPDEHVPPVRVAGIGSFVDLDNRSIVDSGKLPPKAICLVFLGPDCPVSNALCPEITRIQKAYIPRGVVFAGVYPDPDVDLKRARDHEKEYAPGLPRILDPKLVLARQVKIEIMPEAAIFDTSGKVLWRGRINDLWTSEGKKRLAPQSHDLRMALDAIVDGKTPPPAKGKAYGCPLPEIGSKTGPGTGLPADRNR
jgi:hypothetical protein